VIPCNGDVHAIAVGPPEYPFRAVVRGQETAVEEVKTGVAVAWYPAFHNLITSPSGRVWAGVVATTFRFLRWKG